MTHPQAFYFQKASPADLDAIVAIEQQSFPAPWSPANLADELNKPYAHFLIAGPAPPLPREVWGYIIFWLIVDEMHVLNLAVRPDQRRRGLGRALVTEALSQARRGSAATAWLEVRPSNLAARALYQSLGFAQVSIRPRYYTDSREDALILALRL